MATYTYEELHGSGSVSEDLTASTEYTLTLTNPSASSYLTLETKRDSNGFYNSSSPKNIDGAFGSLTSVQSLVTSSYIASVEVPTGGGSFTFTPTNNITGTTLYLRGTGYVGLEITGGGGGSPVDLGTQVAFTAGTLFDAYSSRDGITSTDAFPTNNGAWQLYYAHDNITISSGASTIGLNPYQNGTNAWTWYYAVASTTNSTGSWGSVGTLAPARSGAYTGGTLTYSSISSNVNVPANTYFLIANSGGPFYRTIKSLAANRTAMVGGSPYITAINKVALGNWPSGGTTTIPTQFGGAGTGYTFYDGYAHVHSVTFS